ncbi:YbaN family protein [Thiocystis violacea]|uniref:YbaN family protein n=1 Tax=Thiocystis violacea TaxID=13725 RepID=UPI0019058788|nr:YbaN family protein [Thiocystis violacea]MBK1718405.1 hypothetical protein [Thiocystis violacea]
MQGTEHDKTAATEPRIDQRRHHIYNILAWLCLGLGFLGMVVPLMPTTVFWICATWLWLRSRPHRVKFLVEHPRFGASIRRFLETGEICRTGKNAAFIGMTGSLLIWIALVRPSWPIALLVAGILALVALWIATRPESPRQTRGPSQVAVTLDPAAWASPRPVAKPPANPPG